MSSLTATFAAQLSSTAANIPAGSRVSLGAFFVQPPMRRRRSRRLVCSAEPYLITKLESAEKTWKVLSVRLADPDVASNPSEYQKLAQSLAELDEVVSTFRSFKDCEKQLEETKALAKEAGNDEDVAEMINSKVASLTNQIKDLQAKLKLLLLPSDPLDAGNIMLEVGAGTGTTPEFDKDLKRVVQKTAATFAPRASTASKNPAVPGSVLYTIFEVQAYACLLLGGALSFNLIFPSNEPDLWRLMGMWSIWMFTIPSLRARDCSKNEKEALNYLFLLVPLLNVMIPFFLKSFAVVWSADVAAFFGMYAWKLGWFSQKEEQQI